MQRLWIQTRIYIDLDSNGCMDPVPERTEWPQKKKEKWRKDGGLRPFIRVKRNICHLLSRTIPVKFLNICHVDPDRDLKRAKSASFLLTCVEPLGLALVGVPDQQVGGLMQCCKSGSRIRYFWRARAARLPISIFATDLCRATGNCCCWRPRPAGWRTYAVLRIRIPNPKPHMFESLLTYFWVKVL